MATIDAKKLLPPSKKTAAIEKQKFLVPLQNISVNKKPAGDLRPVDKETKSSEDLSIVKKKSWRILAISPPVNRENTWNMKPRVTCVIMKMYR